MLMAATTTLLLKWVLTRMATSQLCVFTQMLIWVVICQPSLPVCLPILYGTLLQGQYTTPAIFVTVNGVFTHTTPVDAYRGAGRPEATYLLERLMDTAAAEMGMDPAELRMKNFIPAFDGVDQPGYQTQVALQYDSGDYEATMKKPWTFWVMTTYAKNRKKLASKDATSVLVSLPTSKPVELLHLL